MGSEILDTSVVSMDNKIANWIIHIKFANKKKPSRYHIVENLRKSDEGAWEIEGRMTSLSNMVTKNLLELTDGTYKVKENIFVEETQISSQIDGFTNPDTEKIVIPETKVTPCINKETHTPIPGKAEIQSLQDFQQTVLSELENMRSFLEAVKWFWVAVSWTKSYANRHYDW